jgi:hypothetical protein
MPRSSPFSRLCAPALAFLLVAALTFGVSGERASLAFAKGNASAAAGFLEDAQNDDGGFGAKKGKGSDPEASLWVAAALLSGGKHPLDEFNKGGDSLDAYLQNHEGSYTTVGQLGVLALVQGAAGYGASHYGDPASKLKNKLTEPAVRASPGGSALAALGLLAVGDETTAKSVAQVLLSSAKEDGGWGSSDSESTALVLQALAKAGVADKSSEVVQKGVEYLHRAQANDGAVMKSIRTDPGSAGGEVTATAFALQALDALGVSSPTTAEGKTFRDGLTQYQQQSTGGLSSNGSLYDSTFAPSVTETAQAYAAFNGTTFPLEPVAAATSGPPKHTKKKDDTEAASTKKKSKKISTGSGATGISDTTADNKKDQGAFQRATVGRQGTAKKGAQDRKAGKRSGGKKAKTPAAGSGGEAVSGEVVGATSAPKLATRAGQDPGGLTDQDKATIGLGLLLVLAIAIGGWLARRRPRTDGHQRLRHARPRARGARPVCHRGGRPGADRGAVRHLDVGSRAEGRGDDHRVRAAHAARQGRRLSARPGAAQRRHHPGVDQGRRRPLSGPEARGGPQAVRQGRADAGELPGHLAQDLPQPQQRRHPDRGQPAGLRGARRAPAIRPVPVVLRDPGRGARPARCDRLGGPRRVAVCAVGCPGCRRRLDRRPGDLPAVGPRPEGVRIGHRVQADRASLRGGARAERFRTGGHRPGSACR